MNFEQAQALFAVQQLTLSQMQYDQLERYLAFLLETNRHINLTAITEPAQVWTKHFLDSALLFRQVEIKKGAACLDVGTGAGFPGMVMAILRPDLAVTLLDTLQKRVHFLEEASKRIGLKNVRCVHARAEDAGKDAQFREQFDFVTARAVASLPVLAEYCLPFVKVGGVFAAMKGPNEDGAAAEHAIEELGGAMIGERRYQVTEIGQRSVYVIEKRSHTAQKYPRRGDKIKKKAL